MFDYRGFATRRLAALGTKYLPFADVASDDVPLSQLLRLSLFQVTVGMALVLLVGTLNRVMIVELGVPAALVGVMLALPLLFAPFRALIGYKSDTHVSALGLRRIPYIWKGTLYQFGGFAVMPFALLVLSGYGEAVDAPRWIGYSSAALAFLLVGAGLHIVQTVGLALATDLVDEADQPKVVGLMYVMLLLGMVVSAIVYGALLENYTPGRLVQVIQGTAVVTAVLNLLAMWKQESRSRERARQMEAARPPEFSVAWATLMREPDMLRLLFVIGLGTLGFGMADVLLEPYGGQVLALSIADTTRLTALLATGTLAGFVIASRVLSDGGSPARMAGLGAAIGIPGFIAIIMSSLGGGTALFLAGTLATGLGAGLFGHSTLTAAIRAAPAERTGLALGAWGAVQATAAGVGVALAGIVRDAVAAMPVGTGPAPHIPYNVVFAIEALFLAVAIVVALPLIFGTRRGETRSPPPIRNEHGKRKHDGGIMTTIITRLFPSRESAAAVAADLDLKRFPRRAVHVITSSSDEGAEAVSAQLERLEVDPAAATAYADHLTKGDTALLVVRATYKPLGAARIAREALADADTIDVGQVPDDIYVPDRPERAPSVLTDHPHMLMLPLADDEIPRGPVTGNFFRLLSPHRTKMSAMSGDNRMSRFFWPMPLLKRHRTANSAIHGGRVMSRRFWPQKLLLSGPRRKAVIPGGGHPMSRLFGWPLISHRR